MVDASTAGRGIGVSVGTLVGETTIVGTGELVGTGEFVGAGIGEAGFGVQATRNITARRTINRQIVGFIFERPNMDLFAVLPGTTRF
jgi:hypothetical protein